VKLIKRKIISNPEVKVDFLSIIITSGLFSGYIPVASGTFGSLFALFFLLIPGFLNYHVLIPVIILTFIISIPLSDNMVKRYGDDPSVVVIDEVIGMWVTFLILKIFLNFTIIPGIYIIILSFLLFRFFDIVKLFPANIFDRIKSGFGIVMDDVISGIYAGFITYIIIFLLSKLNIYL